ncbi:aspartate kinase [Candidatus Micrarchaeota archaeon]|nr:aspartate kinase [Candidatus Micrarchaeota archaeon]
MIQIHKFGGGILRDADGYLRAAQRLTQSGPGQVAVVSALYGVTDELDRAARNSSANHVDEFSRQLLQRHMSLIEPIASADVQKDASAALVQKINRLTKILYGIQLLEELTPRTLDLVHSFGERLSAIVLDAHVRNSGMLCRAWMSDQAGLLTNAAFGNAAPMMDACRENLRKNLLPDAVAGAVVFTGYFGQNADGHVTTLGRGGSDYSAGLVANCLDAEKLWVWKDVDGFMSADPKVVPSARLLSDLSYDEAEELGYFGAKILHPKTMAPLREKRIPAEIRNIRTPEKPGTVISVEGRQIHAVAKSVAIKKDACLVSLNGGALGSLSGTAYPLFEQLRQHDLPIDAMASSQADLTLCFEAKYLPLFQTCLASVNGHIAPPTVEKDVAVLGLVGEGMRRHVGTSGKLFSCLAKAGVNIRMISQGASEINITVGIARGDVDKALKAVHAEFIE